jgi:GLPGLI family protein
MNKHLPLLMLLLLPFALTAQQQTVTPTVNAWEIHYGFHMEMIQDSTLTEEDRKNAAAMQVAQLLLGDDEEKPALRCYMEQNRFRVEQNGLVSSITLADKRDTVYYIIDTSFKQVIRHSALEPAVEVQMAGDSIQVISSEDFEMTLSDDTTTLAGFPCKKARFYNPSFPGQAITVWYTERIPVLYWGKYKYLQKLPGCPLAVFMQQGSTNIGIRVKKAAQVEVPGSLFQLPEGYEITEPTL